jgi:hypothetical protein
MPCRSLAFSLRLCATVGIAIYGVAIYGATTAYGMDCPTGLFATTDSSGNVTCRGFNTGESDAVQTDQTVSVGNGALPGLDRWGTGVIGSNSVGDVPPDGGLNCGMGAYASTDLEGNAVCRNYR